MKTETYTDAAAFRSALGASRKRSTRLDIPRAQKAAPTGLAGLIKAGWCPSYVVGKGWRMTRGALDTGYQDSEKAMCDRAKDLGR